MGFFRGRKSRQITNEPLPDWDDTRWRSHLRSNALGTDHHCNIYVEMINADRKEAARLFKNDDETRARSFAESAIRNKRVVTALGALSPLCNALYQRSEPLAGYTSLAQIPETARSSIVTIIFAASRLQMSYLTETVNFLREQFGSIHVDQIQKGEGELDALVNPTVREALASASAPREEVDAELASAVKEYFGVSVPQSQARSTPTYGSASLPSQYAAPPVPRSGAQNDPARKTQTTPLSAQSSDIAAPMSPQLTQQDSGGPLHERNIKTPSPPQRSQRARMYGATTAPPEYAPPEAVRARQGLAATVDMGSLKRGRGVPTSTASPMESSSREALIGSTGGIRMANPQLDQEHARMLQERKEADVRAIPEHLRHFEDSDEVLLRRYEHLRAVISV